MVKSGTYYLGRVIKLGLLDESKIFEAISNPATIVRMGNAWTIINSSGHGSGASKYAYGRLCKFAPETEVAVIDLMKKAEVFQPEVNLILASSSFVYIPEHSGIAFLQIWNHIEPKIFIKRFCAIINETQKRFFAECQIDPIADMRTFAIKLSKLEGIYRIIARVFPPNPLFGPLWGPLKEYLAARKAETMKIEEESSRKEPLKTRLPEHVASIAENRVNAATIASEPLPIGDAAILMAADGYGTGLVKGRVGTEFIVIRTSETIRNFSFDRDPEPEALYKAALEIFEKIKEERHMEHDS